MLNNTPESRFSPMSQFVPGTTVYDSAGEKVGRAIEQNSQGGYLVVEKGLLFLKDVYIPFSAITRADSKGIYLNMSKDELKGHNWENIPTTATTSAATSAAVTDRANMSAGEDIAVPVREEEMLVGKRGEETGQVRVSRDVIEEQQTASVPLTHEEVIIERVPVEGRSADVGSETLSSEALAEKDIVIPLRSEEPVIGKRTEVTEEVRIHKQPVTEQRQVSETVRKERVNIEAADEYGETPLEQTSDEDLGGRPLP